MEKTKIITPSITVFKEDESIDYEGNKIVIDHLVNNGMDGILVLGSSGEFTGLSLEEKKDFLKFYYEYTNDRTKLYAGTGDLKLERTIELSNYVLDMGYEAVVVITPYYYGLDQEKIYIYFDKIAKSISGDMFIYNFPDRSGNSISDDTLYKLLKENKNIKGIKDSVLDYYHTTGLIRKIRNNFGSFEVYSGYDDQFLLNIFNNGNGCIAALSNIVPEIWRDWVKAANNKDFEKTNSIQVCINDLMPLYNLDSNFSLLFKKLMKYRGLNINTTSIFPYNQINDEKFEKAKIILDNVLKKYNK
ncbi:dihydrodipicolinate synthase family protein [Miniphocaeibacter massiliensis]|uniref:dihydrodipicolinate synthase family protein n=1 Tax=Miniphocaeibacter massiliensis TaxID=2041841 RepID=UPI001F5C6814|nr:dihydrodipicolinate synthase family protein [Miniphocaeibacter massiliensis]